MLAARVGRAKDVRAVQRAAEMWHRSLSGPLEGEVYTHGHHQSVVSQHAKRTVENSARFLLEAVALDPRSTELLDVGCGPGSITAGFAGRCKRVVGMDRESEVLEQAREAAQGAENVELMAGNVYELPFDDGSFDVVFAHQVLQHLVDPVAALREMKRVAKPGGYVAVRDADYESMLTFPALPEVDEWRRIYRATCRRNRAEPDAGRYLNKWMQEAGFDADAVRMSMCAVPYLTQAEVREWGEAWKKRSLESAFAAQAQEYGLASREDLERISAAWASLADTPGATFYYVNGEAVARKASD